MFIGEGSSERTGQTKSSGVELKSFWPECRGEEHKLFELQDSIMLFEMCFHSPFTVLCY